jgi:CO dehydrogenase/acetyl-CoA synthase beta subunit
MHYTREKLREKRKEFPFLNITDIKGEQNETETETLIESRAFRFYNTMKQIQNSSQHLVSKIFNLL